MAGIRTLKNVEPVSTVNCVVTVTNSPISVFRVRIWEPAKCLMGPGAWVTPFVAGITHLRHCDEAIAPTCVGEFQF